MAARAETRVGVNGNSAGFEGMVQKTLYWDVTGVAVAVDAGVVVAGEMVVRSMVAGQGRIVVVAVGGSVAVAASCKIV